MGFENFIKKHFPGLETDEESAREQGEILKTSREARVQSLLAERTNLEKQLKDMGEWQGKDDYRTQHDNAREEAVRAKLAEINDELQALEGADDDARNEKKAA